MVPAFPRTASATNRRSPGLRPCARPRRCEFSCLSESTVRTLPRPVFHCAHNSPPQASSSLGPPSPQLLLSPAHCAPGICAYLLEPDQALRPFNNRRQRLSNPHRSQWRRRPSDSQFPSLEVFERRPCLGGQQWSMKGRHPKTFTRTDIPGLRLNHAHPWRTSAWPKTRVLTTNTQRFAADSLADEQSTAN